jgi:hypothetical protein
VTRHLAPRGDTTPERLEVVGECLEHLPIGQRGEFGGGIEDHECRDGLFSSIQ